MAIHMEFMFPLYAALWKWGLKGCEKGNELRDIFFKYQNGSKDC